MAVDDPVYPLQEVILPRLKRPDRAEVADVPVRVGAIRIHVGALDLVPWAYGQRHVPTLGV